MQKLIKMILIIALGFTVNSVQSQTCRTVSEIPSTTPDSRFTNNQDGTITDKYTGLMWQRCQLGRNGNDCEFGNLNVYNWLEALDQADSNMLANHTNWRLPNHKELDSIVEQRCFDPSINTNFFPNTSNSLFWSSSPYASNASGAWFIGFSQGSSNTSSRNVDNYVRLVRAIN